MRVPCFAGAGPAAVLKMFSRRKRHATASPKNGSPRSIAGGWPGTAANPDGTRGLVPSAAVLGTKLTCEDLFGAAQQHRLAGDQMPLSCLQYAAVYSANCSGTGALGTHWDLAAQQAPSLGSLRVKDDGGPLESDWALAWLTPAWPRCRGASGGSGGGCRGVQRAAGGGGLPRCAAGPGGHRGIDPCRRGVLGAGAAGQQRQAQVGSKLRSARQDV